MTSPSLAAADKSEKRDRRRHQCRQSQKSFRLKKKNEFKALVANVASLEAEVAVLRTRIHHAAQCIPLPIVLAVQPSYDGGPPVKVVRTFLALFRSQLAYVDIQGYDSAKIRSSARQRGFFVSAARAHLRYNGEVGIENMLSEWQRYSDCFASVCMEALRYSVIKTDDGAVVTAETQLHLKPSFPIARVKYSIDLYVLIGQMLVARSTMVWGFDNEDFVISIGCSSGLALAVVELVTTLDMAVADLMHVRAKDNAAGLLTTTCNYE
ncbi:hypothetical protein ACHHYP_16592 [Achlya hypogyna]|uniref:BZIP domain-containing protein n=1 Tax=Achlya hypogyna TaxID=1202772 RepID=A0A1V9ZE87_ACHHY|nr:hypothetical protein ACHHYP_16592 [Achlya hypogyna]